MHEVSGQIGWYANWQKSFHRYRTAPLNEWEHSLIHDLLLHSKWFAVSLSVIFSIALYAVWGHVPGLWIWLFLFAFLIEAVVKVALAERYSRLPRPRQFDPEWRMFFDAGAVYAGVVYGMAFLVMFHPMPMENRYLLIAVFCTMVCGTSVTSAFFQPISRSTYPVFVAPTIIALLLSGRPSFYLLALLLTMTVIISLCLGAASQRRFRLVFDLNERNRALVHGLSQQRAKAEHHQSIAEQAVVDKSRFVAMASHDLRQPLHALGLFHHALRLKSEEPANSALFDSIDQSTIALNAMFDSLLDISKLDANVVNPELEPLEVGSVFELLEQEFEPIALTKNLHLSCQSVDALLFTDRTLFTRILRNLLSNAFKFTETGSVTLAAIRCNDDLIVSVSDTGSGIPTHEQEKVFAEFYQLGAEERRGEVGVGLGLSIVRRLCDLLEIKVSLVSEASGGTRVSLHTVAMEPQLDSALQRVGQESSICNQKSSDNEQIVVVDIEHHSARSEESSNIQDAIGLHVLSVLIIDDEQSIRQGMKQMLRHWGWSPVCVADEYEALAQMAEGSVRPDIVVCDYQLAHGKTGVDAVHALREYCGYTLPAILVSGASAPDELLKIERSGLQCLTKPVSPEILRATISTLVKRKCAQNTRDAVLN